jgi:hypothetical protein
VRTVVTATYSCLDRLLLELLVERADELWHFLLEQVQGTAGMTRRAVFYNFKRQTSRRMNNEDALFTFDWISNQDPEPTSMQPNMFLHRPKSLDRSTLYSFCSKDACVITQHKKRRGVECITHLEVRYASTSSKPAGRF